MNYQYNIHQGIYKVQSGFKSTTALIICPYLTQKVQVQNAHLLKILDGSEVYWAQIRRFIVNKKISSKQQTIIQAAILGVKHCKYICEGINILCSISSSQIFPGTPAYTYARPISDKLPAIRVSNAEINAICEQGFWHVDKFQFYYWVRIINWDPNNQYPDGIIIDKFKKAKTAESEAQAVLYSLEINQNEEKQQFPLADKIPKNQAQLPVNNHIPLNQTIFSIDPKDCDDMEDAFSLVTLDQISKIYEIGIHISDVSSYLHLVDRNQICQQGCTIYLPHKKISLFPQQLTEICCFKQKKQRLAISLYLKMNEEGQILDTRFQKTVIINSAALTYEEAQQLIDKKGKSNKKLQGIMKKHSLTLEEAKKINKNLFILEKIASVRRKVRKGQQVLDRNEVTFELDQKKMPIQIGIRKRLQTQRIVEEFMIAANGVVAKKLVQDYGANSLVISHPRPTQYSINNFNSFLSDYGIKFNSENILSLQREIKKLFEKQEIKDEIKQVLLIRAVQMQELATYTKYYQSEKGHFGLNMSHYTHFTSPLRRFADVIVHQQLKSCVFSQKQSPKSISLASEIEILNKIRIKSKKLKHRIVECFLNLLLHEKKQKIQAKALLMSMGKKSATIYIPIYNLVKQVPWRASVECVNRDSINIEYTYGGDINWKIFQKNDAVNIQICAGVHQQVAISMFFKIKEEKFEI